MTVRSNVHPLDLSLDLVAGRLPEPESKSSNVVHLDAASIEAVARRVVELLAEPAARATSAAPPLVDAGAVAAALGVSRSTVYEHAEALGARRLGDGRRARLRFDVAEALERWTRRSASGESLSAVKRSAEPKAAPRRRARTGTGGELLPIGPDAARQARRERRTRAAQ